MSPSENGEYGRKPWCLTAPGFLSFRLAASDRRTQHRVVDISESRYDRRMTTEQHADRVYIREAAEQLNRRMATLRKWEQLGILPDHLLPHRGQRGWRYWTPEQIEGIRKWLKDTDRRPGKGLPNYNPTEAELDRAIAMMRKPHGKTLFRV